MQSSATTPFFLIAMPQLADPNFSRSVILIMQHTFEGAIGLVVNRPSHLNLGTFARSKNFLCHASLENVPVFQGGPVEMENGWILHTDETVEEKKEIAPGVYLSGTIKTLESLLEAGHKDLKLTLGYAGWSAGQLEVEMAQGSWVTANPDKRYILECNTTDTWNNVLKDMGVDPLNLTHGSGVH